MTSGLPECILVLVHIKLLSLHDFSSRVTQKLLCLCSCIYLPYTYYQLIHIHDLVSIRPHIHSSVLVGHCLHLNS